MPESTEPLARVVTSSYSTPTACHWIPHWLQTLLSVLFVLISLGTRSFSVATNKLWNSLPLSPAFQMCTSPDTHRHHINTHYFQQPSNTLSTFLLAPHIRLCWPLCAFINYNYLLTYLPTLFHTHSPLTSMLTNYAVSPSPRSVNAQPLKFVIRINVKKNCDIPKHEFKCRYQRYWPKETVRQTPTRERHAKWTDRPPCRRTYHDQVVNQVHRVTSSALTWQATLVDSAVSFRTSTQRPVHPYAPLCPHCFRNYAIQIGQSARSTLPDGICPGRNRRRVVAWSAYVTVSHGRLRTVYRGGRRLRPGLAPLAATDDTDVRPRTPESRVFYCH